MKRIINKFTFQILEYSELEEVKWWTSAIFQNDFIDLTFPLPTCEQKYWIFRNNEIQEMTPAEKLNFDNKLKSDKVNELRKIRNEKLFSSDHCYNLHSVKLSV